MASGKSLEEVNQSVRTDKSSGIRKFLAFAGPAYMVSVGYMDPGNWATDLKGGSEFGYSLLWVLVMSNLIALLLQSHSARLGIVAGKDLAQASKETYPRFVNLFLYFLAEIAIAAMDLAEVIGMAIGLQLLFKVPLLWGVTITVLDTFLLLFLLNFGIRKLEAIIIFLVVMIGASFAIEIFLAHPSASAIAGGLIPHIENNHALIIAVGIIGATVMPHNLYLHSSLVQTRKIQRTDDGIKKAIRYNVIDSAIALNAALFVNAAILILAASSFPTGSLRDKFEIQDAHRMLDSLFGPVLAPVLFAIALIASGQSSTITGTLSGQIVMEGYLSLRIRPWLRRMLTRLIAIVPAFCIVYVYGEGAVGDMLVMSQVILSMQLGFAVVPLIHFVSDKEKMKQYAIGIFSKIFSWIAVSIIVALNVKVLADAFAEGLANPAARYWIIFLAIPFSLLCGAVLLYITFEPVFRRRKITTELKTHGEVKDLELKLPESPSRIAVTVDFSTSDSKAISKALLLGGKNATYILIHVVETASAHVSGKEAMDLETKQDAEQLNAYMKQMQEQGYVAEADLEFGNPVKAIPRAVKMCNAQLLIMGAHGHTTLKDIILGTTVESVRHSVGIPVLIV
jgi:manganese transport protein